MSGLKVSQPVHTVERSGSILDEPIIMAIPRGRLGRGFHDWFTPLGIQPEDDFFDGNSRKLLFRTNINNFRLIRVRSFDVITYVAFAGASLGVVGSDILAEFNSSAVFAPVDLNFGHCRLATAELVEPIPKVAPSSLNGIRVASKYPNLTRAHFHARGVQCECIKLNGAIELAPKLGICPLIVDLVGTGQPLKANGLVDVETILKVSARLVVNRVKFKTASIAHHYWIEKFREIVDAHAHQE